MDSATNDSQRRQAALDQVGRLVAVPTLALTHERHRSFSFSASFGEIPVEVDYDLANLVLPAYRLSEPGETPGSALPDNPSQ
jgi:hypothetical protein